MLQLKEHLHVVFKFIYYMWEACAWSHHFTRGGGVCNHESSL